MAAAALFSSAQSLFGGSKLAGSYTIAEQGAGRSVAGLWTIQRGTHKSSGKAVSIWTFDKGNLGGGSKGRLKLDATVEVLKKEVSMLSRLRHPCVLEVVEPLEDTRPSLTFATEQVTSSLSQAIQASDSVSRTRRGSTYENLNSIEELDETEIQKGLSQIGKALQFCHESAKLVHSNLTPEAIIINAKGDWKLSGFGLSAYLASPAGQAKWDFPQHDRLLPQAVQKDFDYLAPEFALDETLAPSNDMYALGCIIFALHTKSGPPLANRGNLQTLRENIENLNPIRASWHRLGDEVQDVLSQLLTRYPSNRLSAASFQSSRYFSSILVSTLRFLDRDTFAGKAREEQASFLKGLLKVLPQFSGKVLKRKILPSLLEETRKKMLVPFLLPCIFFIGQKMNSKEFREILLPSIKPLFDLKDPPQAILTMLDALTLFNEKCGTQVFRDEILPLIYNALESDVPPILEKALKVVPTLSEALDYTTVKGLLLPKITAVFSKTTSLSVKVTTLVCFKSLVPLLDKFTLTEKLVPLLSKIKTKEPSVMVATMAVHEQIGLKCDIQAIATLVLPQLWAMSITPLLSPEHFAKFMNVIKQLGLRVEEEHSRHLAEIKRLEESSGGGSQRRGSRTIETNGGGEVDFETLVRGNSGTGSAGTAAPDPFGVSEDMARFDSLSVTASPPPVPLTSSFSPPLMNSSSDGGTLHEGIRTTSGAPTVSSKAASLLGARPISAATYHARNGLAITPDSSGQNTPISLLPPPILANNSVTHAAASSAFSAFNPPANPSGSNYNSLTSLQSSMNTYLGATSSSLASPAVPNYMAPLQPTISSLSTSANPPYTTAHPPQSVSFNYIPAMPPPPAIQWSSSQPQQQSVQWANQLMQPAKAAPPGWTPSAILQPQKKETSFDWADLDPMR